MALRQKIRAIAQARPRFGYRRILVMLKREGVHIGGERLRRLYREEGLSLRMRPKRRRKLASHLRIVASPPRAPHERWSMDFMVDSFMDGRRFRVLTVVDIYSRHSPIIEADHALNGAKVGQLSSVPQSTSNTHESSKSTTAASFNRRSSTHGRSSMRSS